MTSTFPVSSRIGSLDLPSRIVGHEESRVHAVPVPVQLVAHFPEIGDLVQRLHGCRRRPVGGQLAQLLPEAGADIEQQGVLVPEAVEDRRVRPIWCEKVQLRKMYWPILGEGRVC